VKLVRPMLIPVLAAVAIATPLFAASGVGAWGTRPLLQHGVSQGVSVDVYRPGRAVFDLSRASAGARSHLRGPAIAPGCVKARLLNGQWQATDYFGPNRKFARRLKVNLAVGVSRGFRAPYDGCEIGGFYGHRWNDAFGTRDAVEIWLTARGRHFFNDRAAARDLAYFVRSHRVQQIRLSSDPRGGLEWFVHRYPGRVVELAAPSGRVPKDVIGFWIGPRTILFTATSSTHRRLYVVAKRGSYRLPEKNLGDLAFVF
jgi:hypothetical protein